MYGKVIFNTGTDTDRKELEYTVMKIVGGELRVKKMRRWDTCFTRTVYVAIHMSKDFTD